MRQPDEQTSQPDTKQMILKGGQGRSEEQPQGTPNDRTVPKVKKKKKKRNKYKKNKKKFMETLIIKHLSFGRNCAHLAKISSMVQKIMYCLDVKALFHFCERANK